jgi:undecaprenyl-diphosphatase
MSENIYAIILGIVQGITEFLPVSSSGHLILASTLVEGEALSITLNIALHMGTVGAVLIYFWQDWLKISSSTFARIKGGQKSFESDVLLPGLIIGSIPAGVIGIIFKDKIEEVFHIPLSICLPLAIVGFLLWYVDKKAPTNKTMTSLTIKDAFLIGVAQTFALIPGTSRSGATIIGGRLLGLGREDAARFSFMLGTPAMAGAAILESGTLISNFGKPEFYIGFVTSLIVGCLAIRALLKFLKHYGFLGFMIYRVALAACLFIVLSI